MGFKVSGDQEDLIENSEINVTPFVDVMLVLLIIVMVAAPLATVNVPVDLPASSATPQPQPQDPFFMTVEKDLMVTLGEDQKVSLQQLPQALKRALPETSERIYLRADKTLDYESLMKVMNTLVATGYAHVALVGIEQPKATP